MTSTRKGPVLPEAFLARFGRWSVGRQIIALSMSLSIGSSAFAQGLTAGGGTGSPTGTTGGSFTAGGASSNPFISLAPGVGEARTAPSSTILPTDVVPLPSAQERTSFGENLQLRVLQRLPAPFYFNTSVEGSFREETNVFQFPPKRKFLTQLPSPEIFRQLDPFTQGTILNTLNLSDAFDTIFRVLPNVTWGWALKPRTRVYGNYFMIRDQLTHWTQLNTVIHSIGYGAQQDIPVGRRGNLQLDTQFRELYQLHSKPVFDFLPGATLSYVITPRMVGFVNALLQLRGKGYFRSPNREIDPFYTFGGYYAKNGWAFSATGTFVQNFRQPFHSQAAIPVNNYSMICDFEIARRLIRQLPGFQVFARAEPIWNFHSHARPGLTGMDFRMFFGMRMQLGKPALTAAYEQIKQQLEEQETTPPPPGKSPGEAKPSAFLMPYQVTADNFQPIHGLFDEAGNKPVAVAYPRPAIATGAESDRKDVLVALANDTVTTQTPVKPQVTGALSDDLLRSAAAASPVQKESVEVAKPVSPTELSPSPSPKEPGAATKPSSAAEPLPMRHATLRPAEVWDGAKVSQTTSIKAAHTARDRSKTPPQAQASASRSATKASLTAQSSEAEPDMLVVLAPSEPAPQVTVTPTVDRSERASEGEQPGAGNSSRSVKHDHKKKKKIDKNSPTTTTRNTDVNMVLVPPLPTVNSDSKENPFGDSGIELKPPILLNPIR